MNQVILPKKPFISSLKSLFHQILLIVILFKFVSNFSNCNTIKFCKMHLDELSTSGIQ